ncbi:MAG: M23 family metallopeptidase [Lachnospiraceae bacterium]|nr:M23 family metallopeptidase [Lachnospiraceae bacterium]
MNRQSRNNRNNGKKERIVMIATSVFVLAALTMTGLYVKKNSEKNKNDGYNIDFSVLEDNTQNNNTVQNKYDEINEEGEDFQPFAPSLEDDLDYTPMEPVDSGDVQNPETEDETQGSDADKTDGAGSAANVRVNPALEGADTANENDNVDAGVPDRAEDVMNSAAQEDAMDQAAIDADAGLPIVNQPEPDFQSGDTLIWPVTGNVLIPYSMDRTVFFSTLQQYKYSPAMVIAALEGDVISAAASGQVIDIFYDEEIGNAVTVNIGNGYKITYGQLKDVAVTNGSYVERGSVIGYVSSPTKYYSVEGTNVYFSLTLNDKPVDPMGELQ